MCGIVGILNYAGPAGTISEERLRSMTDEIQHRGPDDDGIYISDDHRVGLGFRRLSIIDLSAAGHQPMATPDGSIWLVFNGEIYNHLDIRRDLEARGYRYRSHTDTETILFAYQEYGIGFIEKLYGMFAIAIWDSRTRRLHLVRDRIGIKPVYYSTHNGVLFFGSEIKAIIRHPDVPRELNEQGLYDYLSLMITPPGESLFRGIRKLEAGHRLEISMDGTITTHKYWDLDHRTIEYSPRDLANEEFCITEIRRLLRDSVRLRMMADVPFGVLLSGGIDSSLNVALMSELMDRPVETFSVGFRDLEKYDELKYARQVAGQFGTNHHEIFLEERAALDFLPKMVWHLDEPNADPVCVPMYLVSKLARDSGTIVVQVGEGSDEQFSGYLHYLREVRYHRYYYSLLPRPLHRIAYASLKASVPESLLTEYARRGSEADMSFYGGAISFPEESKRKLLSPDFIARSESTGRVAERFARQLESLDTNGSSSDYLRQMIYYEFKSRLAELLLIRVDKMSMATSVEARVPFLDHRLVEFSFQMPGDLKLRNGIPKYILKKAAEGIIPNDIIYRRKQGFAAPVTEWFRSGELGGFARERIFGSGLTKAGYFNTKRIEQLFDRHSRGKANHSVQLWTLLIAAMWYDRHIDNRA
jgi:asparagine synthase (glutamine-hydrolysing)